MLAQRHGVVKRGLQAPAQRRGPVPQPRTVSRRAASGGSGGGGADLPAALELLGLSALRFAKPTLQEIEALVAGKFSGRELNHADVGASISAPNLPESVKAGGYMVTTNRSKIGQGRAAYDAAVAAVKAWEQLQLGWNFTTRPAVAPGTKICSATQTIVPWSVLPAQVVYSREDDAEFGPGNKGRRFAVGLASLSGHLLAGEERFAVELHADGSVWYEVYLFSKPNTLLAWASLPVIKLMQIRYVNDSIAAVSRAAK